MLGLLRRRKRHGKKKKIEVLELPYKRLRLSNGEIVKVARVLSVDGDSIIVEDIHGKVRKILKRQLRIRNRR